MTTTSRVGAYAIRRELGRGGMAVVYLGFDQRIDRAVAVKWLSEEHSKDRELVARFLQEARLVAGLEFPSIVPIYDVGEHEGRPYYVMRYLAGGSLAERRLGRLSPREVVAMLQPIAMALHQAHERNVLHRDVKPANILIDQEAHSYLSDFGIAKNLSSNVRLTQEGWLGTPEYMSPELARGEPASRQTDIYALGVTLFQAVTGRTPFSGGSAIEILNRHINEPVPLVGSRPANFSLAVDKILEKAMAKHASQRFATARDFADALGALPLDEPESIAPPTPTRATLPTLASASVTPIAPAPNQIFATKDRAFCLGRTSDLIVLVQPRAWTLECYQEMTHGFAELARGRPHKTVLVYAPDQSPGTAERRYLSLHTPRCVRTAVVTSTIVMRQVMTAMGWMLKGEKIHGFAPAKYCQALAWLKEVADFDPAEGEALLRRLLIWSSQTTAALDGKK